MSKQNTRLPAHLRLDSADKPLPNGQRFGMLKQQSRRGDREAEGAALEMPCTPKAYRGFESLPLRLGLARNLATGRVKPPSPFHDNTFG